jgi:putative nucleotidyltransferase with HDIG domain
MEKTVREKILGMLSEYSTSTRPVYLVGGAVRDYLLDAPIHDLDFVLPGETRSVARALANRLNGAFYVMDEARDTTRVVLNPEGPPDGRCLLDFASLRAETLEGDLRARDFTINAIAMDVAHPDRLLDPTGGRSDLRSKWIRPCSPNSLKEDPVRVLRAVRQALKYQFRISPETLQQMRSAAPDLVLPSAERLRDELMRMLEGPQVNLALRILDQVGALNMLLPELESLKGVTQTAPHTEDVWNHTLRTLQALEQLYSVLVEKYDQDQAADLFHGSASLWLGRYRAQFQTHFQRSLTLGRTARGLLFLAALYHDIGKPQTRMQAEDGRVRFLGHAEPGAEIAARRARLLALSTGEVQAVETMVAQHMRVHDLAHHWQDGVDENISRRAIYRYFRNTGEYGIDICLLSLADTRGTYGVTLPQDVWDRELKTCRALLEAYWEKHDEVVAPTRLLSGQDVMTMLDLKPGPVIGQLLAAIHEAQAVGEIHTRAEAEAFSYRWLEASQAVSHDANTIEGEGNG